MWSRRKPGDRARSEGFMLVEVLVTAAVAAVLLAALMRAFSSVWGGIGAVREETEAMLVARAVLEASTPRINVVPLTQEGMAGRYAWAISIVNTGVQTVAPAAGAQQQQPGQQSQMQSPGQQSQMQTGATSTLERDQGSNADEQDREDSRETPWSLFRITVAVRAPSGRSTTLETYRLSRPPAL
jgi:hypothetical protein